MIHAQQESIDTLKQILSQLREGKKKPKAKTSFKKSKGKRKEGESHLLLTQMRRNSPTLSRPSLRPKREAIQRM